MSATIGTADREQLHDPEELPIELARYTLTTSNGTAKLSEADLLVVLSTGGNHIRRDIWLGDGAWKAVQEGWEPEGIIWPTWPVRPADGMSSAESALSGVRRYWNKSGYRLRDSAKWAGNPVTFTVLKQGQAPISEGRERDTSHHRRKRLMSYLAVACTESRRRRRLTP